MLRSLQYLEMQGEAQRLSFRALDIEQIGHVYEGLLDHTAKRASEPVLGLAGAKGKEREIPLARLEELKAKGNGDLIKFLKDETGRSESALKRALEAEADPVAGKVRAACGNDEALHSRVIVFSGLLRSDPFGRPVVIHKGSVYVTAGSDRRSTGTHYTPRSLTEPIVKYTLEPLVYVGPAEGLPENEWKLKSPRDLLDLKICDMACGSGAFLVQACRYLSELLVEAWENAEKQHPDSPGVTPEGAASTGAAGESLIPMDPNERLTYAKRLIAQRCLYGVDKNPLAVEMAKLSLWLLTLAKDKPFTFLDHCIRPGDSLVGIRDLDQLKYFNLELDEKRQNIFTGPVMNLVEEAITLRRKLEESRSDSVADVDAQRLMLEETQRKTARQRYAADLLISIEFEGAKGREKDDLHNLMATKAGHYIGQESAGELREAAHAALKAQSTFHWPLEFPEVFVEQGGFDAIVGNPPFMGGTKLETAIGEEFREFIVINIGNAIRGIRGTADLCVYFLLRAATLTAEEGGIGILATNTISQGDSRTVGLEQLFASNWKITRATPSQKWPGIASLEIACVWLKKRWSGQFFLNSIR
ncbi:MAG TPA: DNA methyltransferase, partial [Blastocatellia bacterium]